MLGWNARPPDPEVVGERWREMWLDRLERRRRSSSLAWPSAPRRLLEAGLGVRGLRRSIEAAVYAVGGWSDGYTNAIPRLLEGLPGPRKGLIGPWSHAWPQAGPPGPTIGFLQEIAALVRPLAGRRRHRDHGRADAAGLRSRTVPAGQLLHRAAGRWVAEPAWPAPSVSAPRAPAPEPGRPGASTLPPRPSCASRACRRPVWTPARGARTASSADWPGDQRAMDGMSLTLHVGRRSPSGSRSSASPRSTLTLASDRPSALVCVRLCEVFADGTSALVTRALQNLTHRESDEHPRPLRAGRALPEPGCGWTRSGTRSRRAAASGVGISPTYWPWAWPSPEPVTLTLVAGARERARPARARAAARRRPPCPEFAEPEESAPLAGRARARRAGRPHRCTTTGHRPGRARLRLGRRRPHPPAQRARGRGLEPHHLLDRRGRPAVGRVRCRTDGSVGRGEWRTRCETDSVHDVRRRAVPRHRGACARSRARRARLRTPGRTHSRATWCDLPAVSPA